MRPTEIELAASPDGGSMLFTMVFSSVLETLTESCITTVDLLEDLSGGMAEGRVRG
jgi:hypothetical protein